MKSAKCTSEPLADARRLKCPMIITGMRIKQILRTSIRIVTVTIIMVIILTTTKRTMAMIVLKIMVSLIVLITI